MNKKILTLFFCFTLFCCSATKAQIISVTPGTDFNVATGTIISLENLQLTPSANFTLSGIAFNKTIIATNSNSIPALSTYYKFSATSTAFSGEVLFTYLDAELNGLTESGLKLLYHNGSAWVFDNSGINYPGTNYVTTTLTSKTLNELSLGTGTLQTYYVDDDGDGYGSTFSVQLYNPTPPAGYSVNNTDCNDADIAVNASTTTTTVVIACGTYTWDVNGQAYPTGGTFSVDVNSCHTEVLELTINTIPAKPIIACWQTLTFDTTDCTWVVSGTAPATPSVTISADNSTICAGSPLVFTAVATNGGTSPTFQWKVNGNSVQNSSSANYTSSNLTSTDVVTVALTSNDGFVLSNGFAIIGLQKWSASNLNVSTYSNGEPIPQITSASEWESTTQGAWCYYNNDPTKDKLYNGYAVTDARGLAPLGSHVPTQAEWQQLVTTLGGTTAASLALRATSGWSNNGNGTNSSHFSALPGGLMFSNSGFIQEENGFWWNATEDTQGNLGHSQMNAGQPYIEYDHFNVKNLGMNVRYVSDTAPCVSSQTVVSSGLTITVTATTVYYQDLDSDGFGNTAVSFFGCAQEGYVSNDLDSNDSLLTYVDGDGDGFGSTVFAPSGITNNFDSNDSLLTYLDLDDDGYGSTTLVSNGVTNNLDCDDSLSTTHPGATEICYDGIDNDCDGTVDEGCVPLVSEVQTAQCGQTLAKIDDYVYANLVAGAQGYRFKVTNIITGQVQTLDRYLRVFKITQLLNYAFNTEYQVEVAVLKYNVWQPTYGAPCTIKTPAPTTQLTSPVNNLSALTDVLYANLVPFATGYQFKITNASNAADTQTINRNLREFRMSLLTGITYNNATYNVQVAVRNTDGITYLPYGPICTVITPAFPSTFLQSSQCSDYEVPNYSAPLYAEPFTGAQGYRFKLENSGLGYAQEVDRYLRTVRLSDFTGLTPGSTYTVKVALKINGVWGSYTGKSCSVIVPGAARAIEAEAVVVKGNFAAVAYPNPFASTFAIQVQTTSKEVVHLKVYDMIGRLVEQRATTADAKDNVAFGERYPSGVYSVVVTQGDITETLRVIKR